MSVCRSNSWNQLLKALSTCLPDEPSSRHRLPKALVAAVLHRITHLILHSEGDGAATAASGSWTSADREDVIDCLAVMDLISLHLTGTSDVLGR